MRKSFLSGGGVNLIRTQLISVGAVRSVGVCQQNLVYARKHHRVNRQTEMAVNLLHRPYRITYQVTVMYMANRFRKGFCIGGTYHQFGSF